MIKKFTHAGLVVRDINKAIDLYSKAFGFEPGPFGVLQIPELGIKSFALIIGKNFIELLEPTDPKRPIGKFLKERGEGLYHISFSVDDLNTEVQSLREKGIIIEDPRSVSSLPFLSRIAFVDPQSVNGAIIELVEHPAGLAPKPS